MNGLQRMYRPCNTHAPAMHSMLATYASILQGGNAGGGDAEDGGDGWGGKDGGCDETGWCGRLGETEATVKRALAKARAEQCKQVDSMQEQLEQQGKQLGDMRAQAVQGQMVELQAQFGAVVSKLGAIMQQQQQQQQQQL